jgi:DNA-binding response OmpR family regulator
MAAKVLIVEDEAVVAFEIRDILRGAGFEIAGCVGSIDKALSALKDSDCDIAILDANLRGHSVEPVAVALQQRGRPFLFVSGYQRAFLPEEFVDAPLLSKPFEPGQLISAVRRLLS